MSTHQTEYVTAILQSTGFSDDDKDCLNKARNQLMEWRAEIIPQLIKTLGSSSTFSEYLKTKELNASHFETLALEWYERLFSGVYNNDYWNDVWLLGLRALNEELEVSHIIAIAHNLNLELQQRTFQTYREGSAVCVARSVNSLISSTMMVASQAMYFELFACVQRAGITKPIIQRMINLEVNSR